MDALALWDTLQARASRTAASPLRRLDLPIVLEMLGQTLATRDDFLAENAAVLVGFARGVAKATLFGPTIPEAAVRIHWKVFRAPKPQSGDEGKALKEALHVFNARFAFSGSTIVRTSASELPAPSNGSASRTSTRTRSSSRAPFPRPSSTRARSSPRSTPSTRPR